MDPIIILLRLLTPLTIFHLPLFGGIASMFLDGIDWSVNIFNIPNIHANYVVLDKLLDIYYLAIEGYVVLKWKSLLAKKIGLGLFALRSVGIILFELTGHEFLLFYFPNIFENFFLFYVAVIFLLKKEPRLSAIAQWISLIILAVPKLIQEYVMHVQLITNWQVITIPGTRFKYDNLYGQLLIVLLLTLATVFLQKKKQKA